LKRLSQSETSYYNCRSFTGVTHTGRALPRISVSVVILAFALAFGASFADVANAYEGSSAAVDTSRDLRDSCRAHFSTARQSEAQLETLKNQPLRMVRIGGELDVALYDRLASVRRQRIAAASVAVRIAQSALSGCLAKQLSIQQSQRMPASVNIQPPGNRSISVGGDRLPARSPYAQEQVYVQPQPVQQRPIRKGCDPETELYGCPIEEVRVVK